MGLNMKEGEVQVYVRGFGLCNFTVERYKEAETILEGFEVLGNDKVTGIGDLVNKLDGVDYIKQAFDNGFALTRLEAIAIWIECKGWAI
jgi:hypothetical protein